LDKYQQTIDPIEKSGSHDKYHPFVIPAEAGIQQKYPCSFSFAKSYNYWHHLK